MTSWRKVYIRKKNMRICRVGQQHRLNKQTNKQKLINATDKKRAKETLLMLANLSLFTLFCAAQCNFIWCTHAVRCVPCLCVHLCCGKTSAASNFIDGKLMTKRICHTICFVRPNMSLQTYFAVHCTERSKLSIKPLRRGVCKCTIVC